MDPQGKVALITGGGSGIGRATALALAEAGAAVVVADVDAGGGAETVSLIQGAGGKATFVETDVTRRQDLQRAVAFAEETYGGLDIAHNNAGVNTGPPRFPDGAPEAWERTLAINLWAVIAGVEVEVPALRRRGGGAIVNTASMAGVIQYVPDAIYAATKHGVVGFTRALSVLNVEASIRVNCVCPGVVDTPMLTKGLDQMSAAERSQRDAIVGSMPLIKPSEVADVVLTLIRDDSLAGEAMGITYGRPPRLIPPAVQFRRDPAQGIAN